MGPEGLDRLISSEDPGEGRGLLGLAFHPDYETNGRFFVHYSLMDEDGELHGATVIAEYRVSGDPNVAGTQERIVFGPYPQPYDSDNGGTIVFNPLDDCPGCLYLGLGDGGSASLWALNHQGALAMTADVTFGG